MLILKNVAFPLKTKLQKWKFSWYVLKSLENNWSHKVYNDLT